MGYAKGTVAMAFVLALPLCAPAEAGNAISCTAPGTATLTGKVRQLQSMREEPQAEVQTFFHLELAAPLCGMQEVNASVIGLVPCANGDTVTMTGEYSPPDKMFNMAFFRGHKPVSCTPE